MLRTRLKGCAAAVAAACHLLPSAKPPQSQVHPYLNSHNKGTHPHPPNTFTSSRVILLGLMVANGVVAFGVEAVVQAVVRCCSPRSASASLALKTAQAHSKAVAAAPGGAAVAHAGAQAALGKGKAGCGACGTAGASCGGKGAGNNS